jgi:ABC-type multidrug transport system ATPase subunit
VSDVEAAATEIALIQKGYLLLHATPEGLLEEVQDKVWEWIVPSSDLTRLRHKHLISSTMRSAQGVEVRAVAKEKPSPEARLMTPRLEDAYLYYMRNGRGR